MKVRPRISGCIAIVLATTAAQAVVLANPGFEAEPILGSGQTALEIGDMKMIETDPLNPNYLATISGIVGWQYALPYSGTGSDHGLWRPTRFGDPTGPQMLFINNWNRRVSQTVAQTVVAGMTYRVAATFAMPLDKAGDPKAGMLQLIAGEMDASNPDELGPDALVMGQFIVGSEWWTGSTLDHVVNAEELYRVQFEVFVPVGSAFVGKALTVSMRTEDGSAGPTAWDDVQLDAVPEPTTWLAMGLGLAILARRRGKLG